MIKFIFKNFEFDYENAIAKFNYSFDDGQDFTESIEFEGKHIECDRELLKKSLFLSFILIGTSYYKAFPTTNVEMEYNIDEWQAKFFNKVYQEGLSQFAFENELRREDLVHFKVTSPISSQPLPYNGSGILALQSGGKDSLLTVTLLKENNQEFTPWYVSSSKYHPDILDKFDSKLATSIRTIDHEGLKKATENGGMNGHVPITYILQSLAVVQSILLNKKYIITSIAHEGEEPHSKIGDLLVTHQWSKTWAAEQDFAEYVSRYISPDIKIGSLLRKYSELRVAELFVNYCWNKYGHEFSSCNIANYQQGSDNRKLLWCSECPKCANSYLLFAPFVRSKDLQALFGDKDLFLEPSLQYTFKGLLGIDGITKPFECVGEVEELRLAYQIAMKKGGYNNLSFEIPTSTFDFQKTYPVQDWAEKMLK